MARKWLRTFNVPFSVVEPGEYHTVEMDCAELTETEDGCPGCQEELDEVYDHVVEELRGQDLVAWDLMLVNRPGHDMDQDEDWCVEAIVSR